MQVSVEEISSIERRLTISVPAEQVEQAYNKQIEAASKKANIKGFRPGKAPKSVVQDHFGSEARSQAYNDVIQKALYEAIVEQKLNPVSTPQVEPKSLLANQPLEFTASFEVLPKIDSVKFTLDNLERPVVEVSDKDVDQVITQLLKQYTKWKIVDRAAQEKDRVVLDYYAIFDGKSDADNKLTNIPLELGSKMMMPGFEQALIGAKAGEEKSIHLNFPADDKVAERAGKPIEFLVSIKQVFEAEVPAMTPEFVQQLGIKSGKEEDLKAQIKQSLEQERDRLVKEKIKEQLFQKLLEQNPIEVPKALVAREAKNIHDEVYPSHHAHDHHDHSDEEMTSFNNIAQKRVLLGLLIAEYAKQADLKVDADKVTKRIAEIASVYENPQEVVTWLSSAERRSGVEAQVMEDQVMDKLMESVKVTDKTMTYAELKGMGA